MSKYCVVLRTKRRPSLFRPTSTWFAVFDSKEDFCKWYTDEIRLRQEIIEEGISTEEEADRICGLARINLYRKK